MEEDNQSDEMEAAKRRLAEMQARFGSFMPKPKVESGIERGEKHSGRTLPLMPDRTQPRGRRFS